MKKSLLQFNDDNDIIFDESSNNAAVSKYLQDYKLGDYVYKDPKFGYNNYGGEKVAICVNDQPSNMLFAILDHPLLINKRMWAIEDSKLETDNIHDFNNGYQNTKYILENYSSDIYDTIWDLLGPNEYIPSINELEIIYNNWAKNETIKNVFNLPKMCSCWSSSQYGNDHPNQAYGLNFYVGKPGYGDKAANEFRSIALLQID